jgi:hypothetical protein
VTMCPARFLFSLALDKTYAVFKISFATMLHAIGVHTGSDIFHFVVFFVLFREEGVISIASESSFVRQSNLCLNYLANADSN